MEYYYCGRTGPYEADMPNLDPVMLCGPKRLLQPAELPRPESPQAAAVPLAPTHDLPRHRISLVGAAVSTPRQMRSDHLGFAAVNAAALPVSSAVLARRWLPKRPVKGYVSVACSSRWATAMDAALCVAASLAPRRRDRFRRPGWQPCRLWKKVL